MKQKLRKVKRQHVDWYKLLFDLEDLKLSEQYWLFRSKHKRLSENRCAYYVLKKNYSTTLLEKYRHGVVSSLDFPICSCTCMYEELDDHKLSVFETDDYDEGDIGSATVAEMRRQNGDF